MANGQPVKRGVMASGQPVYSEVMASGQGDDTGSQQQDEAGTASCEEVWRRILRESYPNFEHQTYFLPPLSPTHPDPSVMDFTVGVNPNDPPEATHVAPSRIGRRSANSKKKEGKKKRKKKKQRGLPLHELFDDNPEELSPQLTPGSHETEEDLTLRRCLSAFRYIPNQPMVVLSQLRFRRYLDNATTNPQGLSNPLFHASLHLLPSLGDLPVELQDGEDDLLIIHRILGLMVGEVVLFPPGSPSSQPPDSLSQPSDSLSQPSDSLSQPSDSLSQPSDSLSQPPDSLSQPSDSLSQPPDSLSQPPDPPPPPHHDDAVVVERVWKALRQLKNQRQALVHLVKDLAPPEWDGWGGGDGVRITCMLMLPNLSRDQLTSVLSLMTSQELEQELCETLTNSKDLTQALRHCVCEEDFQRLDFLWWNNLHGIGTTDPSMTSDLYQRLVARFCGPASTVHIPTPFTSRNRKTTRLLSRGAATPTPSHLPPSEVMRSMGQTSLGWSALTLTLSQVGLLNDKQDPRFLYIQGPPSTGKTVVLILKALKWVKQKKRVVIISQPAESAGVSLLIERQLIDLVGEEAASQYVHHHSCNFAEGLNVRSNVTRLWCNHGMDCAIICDEFPVKDARSFEPWLREVRYTNRKSVVWVTGEWTRDRSAYYLMRLPPWVEVRKLLEPVRGPAEVMRAVQNVLMFMISPYSRLAPVEAPTQKLRHHQMPGHMWGNDPNSCELCADNLAVVLLKQLRVGQPGQPLHFRDVWILSSHKSMHPGDTVLVSHLREKYGIPIRRILGHALGEVDAQELALGVTDQIIETDLSVVRGLERKIVISLAPGIQEYSYMSFSRATNRLICIDHPSYLPIPPPSPPRSH